MLKPLCFFPFLFILHLFCVPSTSMECGHIEVDSTYISDDVTCPFTWIPVRRQIEKIKPTFGKQAVRISITLNSITAFARPYVMVRV